METLFPSSESAHLKLLRQTRSLHTPDEGALDAVTRTATQVFGLPVVLISLLDHDRQWFKTGIGLPAREIPIDGYQALSERVPIANG